MEANTNSSNDQVAPERDIMNLHVADVVQLHEPLPENCPDDCTPGESPLQYRGINIHINYSEDHDDPQSDGDGFCFHLFEHRQHTVEFKRDGHTYTAREVFNWISEKPGRKLFQGQYWIFQCFAYIHSGVALSVGNPSGFPDQRWDVSNTGYFLVRREKGKTWSQEGAKEVAEVLCESWNEYLSGDVYCYRHKWHSCCGFYGKTGRKQMIAEAKSEIDAEIERLEGHYSFVGKRYTTWFDETLWTESAIKSGLRYGVYDNEKDEKHYFDNIVITSTEQARHYAIMLNGDFKIEDGE